MDALIMAAHREARHGLRYIAAAHLAVWSQVAAGWAWGAQQRTISVAHEFGEPRVTAHGASIRVSIPGCSAFHRLGEPVLPFRTARVLVPPGWRVTGARVRTLEAPRQFQAKGKVESGRTPLPLGPGRLEALAQAARDKPNAAVYESAEPYPRSRVELLSGQRLCGYEIAILRLFPIQYHPTKGILLHSRKMRLDLDLAKQPDRQAGDALPRRGGPHAARVAACVDNPELMVEYDRVLAPAKTAGSGPLPTSTYDYALISSAALLPSFAPLLAQKQADGVSVTTETTASICASYPGRDDPEKIRNYIRHAYQVWGVQYVLLGGDASVVPYRSALGSNVPTDLYYSCLDGTWNGDGDAVWGEANDGEGGGDVDLLGEVYVGRAPVDTADEAAMFVNKVVAYEQSGTPNCDQALLLGESLGSCLPPEQGGDVLDTLIPSFSAYAIDWLDDRPETSPQWNASDCTAKLNGSPHIVVHFGHGSEVKALRLDRPAVRALTNEHLFLVNSAACSSGDFAYSDCIGEEFAKGSPNGAFAVIMNTSEGYYDPEAVWRFSGEFQQTFFNRLLHQGATDVGRALQLSKHDMIGSLGVSGGAFYRYCYYEITLLGDPHTALKTFPTSKLTVKSFDATSGVNDYFTGVTITVGSALKAITEFAWPYAVNAEVVLTAPESHGKLRFGRWQLDGVDQPDHQRELSVTITADRTAVAVYHDAAVLSLVETADSRGVRPGETVTVKLNVSNLGERQVNSIHVFLDYDDSCLGDPKGVTLPSSGPWSGGTITGPTYEGGEVEFAVSIAGSTNLDAEAAVLTFTAADNEGTAYVRFRTDDPEAGEYTTLSEVPGNTTVFPAKWDAGEIVIDGTSPYVELWSPEGGETLRGGDSFDVEWWCDEANLAIITLQYSTDGGATWTTIDTLAADSQFASDGWYPWDLPLVNSDRCFVKVIATDKAGNVGEAVLADPFTIDSTGPALAISSVKQNGMELLGGPPAARGTLAIQVAATDALTGLAAPPTVTLTFADDSTSAGTYLNEAPSGTFNYTYTLTAATPSGTCRVEAQATDTVGNTGTAPPKQFTINVRVLTATVQLEGYTGSPGAQLPFRFVFSDATGAVLERRDGAVAFANGRDTETVVLDLIPAGTAFVSCKETLHFLRRRVAVGGTAPDYTAALTGNSKLLGGDYSGDNFVDATDFAQFLRDFSRSDRPETDINGDGVVDIMEFGYIATHYFQVGDPE